MLIAITVRLTYTITLKPYKFNYLIFNSLQEIRKVSSMSLLVDYL